MKLIAEAGTAFLLCAAVVCAVQLIRQVRPPAAPCGEGMGICLLIAVQGDAPELESTVRELLSGPTRCILIADCGLSPEARWCADILQRAHDEVMLLSPEEIPKLLGETKWTPPTTP